MNKNPFILCVKNIKWDRSTTKLYNHFDSELTVYNIVLVLKQILNIMFVFLQNIFAD